jgi:hypothetical protein
MDFQDAMKRRHFSQSAIMMYLSRWPVDFPPPNYYNYGGDSLYFMEEEF